MAVAISLVRQYLMQMWLPHSKRLPDVQVYELDLLGKHLVEKA